MKKKPLLPCEKNIFGISVYFEHECSMKFNQSHSMCFPVVSTLSLSATMPTAHILTYANFRKMMLIALAKGKEFCLF